MTLDRDYLRFHFHELKCAFFLNGSLDAPGLIPTGSHLKVTVSPDDEIQVFEYVSCFVSR